MAMLWPHTRPGFLVGSDPGSQRCQKASTLAAVSCISWFCKKGVRMHIALTGTHMYMSGLEKAASMTTPFKDEPLTVVMGTP